MSRRRLALLAAFAVVAGALAASIFARVGTDTASAGGCRDWVAARMYTKEITAVRPLVQKMKRAFAAPGQPVSDSANG